MPEIEIDCPVYYCLKVIGGRWKPLIIFLIYTKVNRFGAMQRSIPEISKQMLTNKLRELEEDGVIHREVFAEVPPRVEYSITDKGKSLYPVINEMRKWGEQYRDPKLS